MVAAAAAAAASSSAAAAAAANQRHLVEFADVILLNKSELLSPQELQARVTCDALFARVCRTSVHGPTTAAAAASAAASSSSHTLSSVC